MQTEVPCFLLAALSAVWQYGTSPSRDFIDEPDAKAFANFNAGYAWSKQAQEEKKKCDRDVTTLEEFQRWLRES